MELNNNGLIERIVRNKIGISELSRILDVSRTSIYNWFQQKQISLDIVCKIGHAIDYDFGNDFPEAFAKEGDKIMASLLREKMEGDHYYTNSIQYWMNKYITLLEKHNELLNNIHSIPPVIHPSFPGLAAGQPRNTSLHCPMTGY